MKSLSRLFIGTAQFGFDYGVTNINGKVEINKVKSILDLSEKLGIGGFDTAQSYGDAEKVLGKSLKQKHNFKIISKLSGQSLAGFDSETNSQWEKSFQKSLTNLQLTRLDSFLLHSVDDLIRPDSKYLIEWLESLKERKLVKNIGVSIYDVNDIEKLPLDKIQIIQILH